MEAQQKPAKKTLPPPSWKGVRSIYKKLSEEFHILTNAFNLTLAHQTKTNLDHLIIVIDEVDNCVDELPDKSARDSVTGSLINYLGDDEEKWKHVDATESLSLKMENIKYIVHKEYIQQEFLEAAKSIFHYTEIKRHTTNIDEIINYIRLEGQATALLPLSILKIKSEEPFGKFFTSLCMIMGIADLVFDANKDYKKGFIKLKPSFTLYTKLSVITLKEGLQLLLAFPKKIKFLAYCFKFAMALLKE